MSDVICYLACRMTGRSKAAMVKEALEATAVLNKYGIIAISPVLEEKIENKNEVLNVLSEKQLEKEWKKDKAAIKKCHVVFDLSSASPLRSEGAIHEFTFARYALFKPVIRLFPKGLGFSVTRLENALIVRSIDEGARQIVKKYGSRRKRIFWRIRERIFLKWLKLIWLQFIGLFR